MKRIIWIVGLIGLAVAIALVMREGAGMVVELLEHASAWLLLLVPLHLLPLLLDSRGWRSLLHRTGSDKLAPWHVLLAIAAVREAINRLLPVANVGGDLIGIRLLTLRGVRGPVAAASVIVEVLLTLLSQYAFVALGVFCLLRVTSPFAVRELFVTLAVALPVIVAIGLVFRYGSLFERGGRLIERLLGQGSQWRALLLQSSELDAEIARLFRAGAGLLSTAGWQLLGLLAGTIETWLALRWLGHPVGAPQALALEALTQAIRNFIFLVPAGIGVQEAGLVALGALLGVNGPTALALSLVKRVREVLFGVPVLLIWQWFETRQLRRSGIPAKEA